MAGTDLPTLIRAVRAVPLDLALHAPFGISRGAIPSAANVLVMVELADGTRGYGEAAPFPAYNGETQAATLEALTLAGGLLPGTDAAEWTVAAGLFRSLAGPDCGSAQCAVETALVDAACRREGIPLWRFFGGAGTGLRTDMTVTTGSAADAAGAARAIRARGIRVIKVKVGGPAGAAADLARIGAILEAAPGSPLILDGNAGMGRAQAAELLAGLRARAITPALLEQWLPRDDLGGMRELGAESGWPVAADESVATAQDAVRVIAAGAATVFNIKLMKAGVREAMKVVSLARGSGIGLMIGGNVESILAMTASACFAAGLGGFEFADLDTPFFMAESPFEGGYAVDGENLSVAHIRAGHGVTPRDL